MPRTITVEVQHGRRESGQVISAVAMAPSRRILGVVDVVVPLMPGYDLSERIGAEGADAIVEAARHLALQVAKAVETEPQQG